MADFLTKYKPTCVPKKLYDSVCATARKGHAHTSLPIWFFQGEHIVKTGLRKKHFVELLTTNPDFWQPLETVEDLR